MHKQSLNRTAVIARAADIADTTGLGNLTLADISRSFGVQTPSLYSHVRNLAELRDCITILAMDDLADRISDAIAGRSAYEALEGFAQCHRSLLNEHPGRWEALQRVAGADALRSAAAKNVVRVTNAVLHGYGIEDEERVHAIRIIGGALNGFLNLERAGSYSQRDTSLEDSWHELIRSLHFLLINWSIRTKNKENI